MQAFETIIDNAVKYSDQGGMLEIRVWEAEGSVNVSFRDCGRGISPQDLPFVFDKFFRGANAGHNGTGLGLSIARKIVEDHGGTISIRSIVDQGTTVHIALPAAREETR